MNNPKSKRAIQKEQKIQEENIQKLDEHIQEQKVIPEEYRRKMRNRTLISVATAVVMVALLGIICVLSLYIETNSYLNLLRGVSILVAGISIIYFEAGYRKDNERIFLYGVEILVFAMMLLATIYLYYNYMFYGKYMQIMAIVAGCIVTYYVVKIFIVRKRMKKQYYKDLNDIKEIVKKR